MFKQGVHWPAESQRTFDSSLNPSHCIITSACFFKPRNTSTYTEFTEFSLKANGVVVPHTKMPQMSSEVLLCPVASLPQLVSSADQSEPYVQLLRDGFIFSKRTGPGWIKYDPRKVTVITANDSFKPMCEVPQMVDAKKQTFRVKQLSDLPLLCKALMKPVLMCVTRRQHSNTACVVDDRDDDATSRNISDNACSGFDIDFAIIFPPGSLVKELNKTLRTVRRTVRKGKKFCVMVDFKKVFRKITPLKQLEISSAEFATWCNGAFWITNFHRPCHSLVYVNNVFFWTLMLPYSWFVAAPYRFLRHWICKDIRIQLKVYLKLVANPEDTVLVHICHSNKTLSPGEYGKTKTHFTQATSTVRDLKPFFRADSVFMSQSSDEL